MKNQLDKLDRIKIRTRRNFLRFAHKQIEDILPGEMDKEEFEMFRKEMTEIVDFLSNKDKYIQAMDYYKKNKKNPHIKKYFKER